MQTAERGPADVSPLVLIESKTFLRIQTDLKLQLTRPSPFVIARTRLPLSPAGDKTWFALIRQHYYRSPVIEYHRELRYSARAREDEDKSSIEGINEKKVSGVCSLLNPAGAGTTSMPCFLKSATDRFM